MWYFGASRAPILHPVVMCSVANRRGNNLRRRQICCILLHYSSLPLRWMIFTSPLPLSLPNRGTFALLYIPACFNLRTLWVNFCYEDFCISQGQMQGHYICQGSLCRANRRYCHSCYPCLFNLLLFSRHLYTFLLVSFLISSMGFRVRFSGKSFLLFLCRDDFTMAGTNSHWCFKPNSNNE